MYSQASAPQTHGIKALDRRLAEGQATLTSAELREELGISPQAASNLLGRWRRAGLVDRVANGRYAIRQLGLLGTRSSSEDVALAVAARMGARPHRIAYHSALDFHGLLTRPVRTIQIASPARSARGTLSGLPLRMVRERARTIAIGGEPAGHGALVSGLERALIDAAARPDLVGGYLPLAEALAASRPDPERLAEIATALGAAPAARRIGSLAQQLGLFRPTWAQLEAPASDIDLDPGLKHDRAFRDAHWRVRWPVTPAAVEHEIAQ